MKKNPFHKHIYKISNGTYVIVKSINGKRKHFKTCKTLHEAMDYRDKLIANNWKPLPTTPEEQEEKNIKEYYKRIQVNSKRYYSIRNDNDEYIGHSKNIEEALYFRDLYRNKPKNEIPDINDTDLKTGNPYYKNGLKYPLPERLIIPEKKTGYGSGSIVQKGPTSFHVHHGKKGNGFNSYVCACPTIEMAEYVRREMNKCDWDMNQLQKILDDYPRYYTYLLKFYQYISRHKLHRQSEGEIYDGWEITIPREFLDDKKSLEKIGVYHNLEDALFERDFLVANDWDYDLLVEQIDDRDNPYYNRELPPYPTRRIRNTRERNYHEKELTRVIGLIKDDVYSQEEICEKIGITPVTLRNWLKNFWNSDYQEFSELVLDGKNPLEVLEKVEQIYQPDLSRALPNNWNNWVSYLQRNKTWQVRKGRETFGTYSSEELAHKISNELQKVDWDKSKLKDIQAKFGHVPLIGSKRWVYRQGNKWAVRRKNKDRRMLTYGAWHDKRIAIIVRDMLLEYGFCMDNRDWIVDLAEWSVQIIDNYPFTMFGKVSIEDIEYIESSSKIPYCQQLYNGDYAVKKTIGRKTVYYGTYPEEKAAEVVEFLEDNNWDKDLLKVMQEMGEI